MRIKCFQLLKMFFSTYIWTFAKRSEIYDIWKNHKFWLKIQNVFCKNAVSLLIDIFNKKRRAEITQVLAGRRVSIFGYNMLTYELCLHNVCLGTTWTLKTSFTTLLWLWKPSQTMVVSQSSGLFCKILRVWWLNLCSILGYQRWFIRLFLHFQ